MSVDLIRHNITEDEIHEKSRSIQQWMNDNKDNSYVSIIGNIWLRGLMNLI
jgi:hypothetical protein